MIWGRERVFIGGVWVLNMGEGRMGGVSVGVVWVDNQGIVIRCKEGDKMGH